LQGLVYIEHRQAAYKAPTVLQAFERMVKATIQLAETNFQFYKLVSVRDRCRIHSLDIVGRSERGHHAHRPEDASCRGVVQGLRLRTGGKIT
jgi:hypothetical protein